MKNHDMNTWAASFGMNIIIRYKWIFLILIVLAVSGGFQGIQQIVMDSSNESFLPEGDETIIQNDRFKEIFGNEEFVFILVEADNVFDHDVLAYIRELSEDLEEHLPFVKEVDSLTNIEYTEAYDDTLYVEDLIGDEIPDDEETLQDLRNKALSKKIYVDHMITKDGKKTGISITFEVIPQVIYAPVEMGFSPLDQVNWPAEKVIMQEHLYTEDQARRHPELTLNPVPDPRKLIAPALNVILKRHQTEKYTVKATGIPVFDFQTDVITSSEGVKFGVIALAASVLLLLVIFRNFTSVAAPFLVLMSTIILAYGMMGWCGMQVSMVSIIIPPLLLVISVGYSIHVINHFRQAFQRSGSRSESIRYAYEHASWPCFLTAITTALGFASFALAPMRPIRDVGLICAFGTFVTYLLVMIIVPALFSFGHDKSIQQPNAVRDVIPSTENPLMTRWADFVIRNPLLIGIVFGMVVLVLCGFSFKFRIESDFMQVLGDHIEFIRDSKYITARLGGLYSFEIFVELPEENMAKQPEVLKTIDRIAAQVEEWEETTLTLSLTDIIKDLNVTMHNNDETYNRIPDNQELIAQYLLLYEMSGGENTEDWVDYDYKKLRLSVQVSQANMNFVDKFEGLARYEQAFPQGTKLRVIGDVPILMKMMKLLSYGQIKSVLTALVVITLIMALILKSLRVGLISMIPNIVPIIAIMGVMGWLDYPIDIMTIMIVPMIIGIAVDDTVHYIVHFKQEFERCGSYVEANRHTFGKVGTAIVFTSVILTFGFSTFGLSIVQSLLHMAVLSGVGIVSALAADLCITPVLFVYFKPFGTATQEMPEADKLVHENVSSIQ